MTEKTDLAQASATELLALYRSGEASPVEVIRDVIDRYERFEDAVNAFVHFDAEAALSAAKASEERWLNKEPLGLVDGVPATIKDLVLMKDVPTRRGSLTSDDTPAAEDAPVTARLREQGAILLGKTTTPEFGWKPLTDSPLTGITRNPWDTSRTPGGSSGGATAILTPERRNTLLTTATMLGLRPFDANLIIAIVQDAARRGEGVDHPQTDGRLKMVPPAGARSVRAKRERSFAIAIVASIVIAFAMLVLAIRWVLGG